MGKHLSWLVGLATVIILSAGAGAETSVARRGLAGAAQEPEGVALTQGDLFIAVLEAQRANRLIGDIRRSPNDNYLVVKLHVRSGEGKTVRVHPRATFAVLSGGTGPLVKYPVFPIGYFAPAVARPVGAQETITVDDKGVTFSLAAEVPKSESAFRLAVQKPVAEAPVGPVRNTSQPVEVKPLEGGAWQGQVARATTQSDIFRIIPGSNRVDTLKPRRHVFLDLGLQLKNADREPRALTAADLLLTDGAGERQIAPLGLLPEVGKRAGPIAPAPAVAPQASVPALRPVWDLSRGQNYTLRVYGVAAAAALPAAQALNELAVDTAEGHLIAGDEHRLLGRLEKALEEYQIVVMKFPDSDAKEVAEGRMADVEVGIIFNNKFLPLPEAHETGRLAAAGNYAEMKIGNDTGMNLKVYYSGPTSKLVDLKPAETKTFRLLAGQYKVGARVPDPHVIPFAGEERMLAGRVYAVTFIIIKGGG